MLRGLVLLLLLANAGFWAWRGGWLEPLHGFIGAGPEGDREPQRLARQVRPDTVLVLDAAAPPSAPPTADGPAPAAASQCLEAGPFTPTELESAQALLDGAWAGGWVVRELGPGRPWWVALGPYADTAVMRQRQDELRRLQVEAETANLPPGTSPWLVLTRHASRERAEAALQGLSARGVRNARVVEGAPVALRALRVAQADAPQQAALAALPAEPLRGRPFAPCATP